MKIKLEKSGKIRGLAVLPNDDKQKLYFYSENLEKICTAQSEDGIDFEKTDENVSLLSLTRKDFPLKNIKNLKISPLFKGHLMFYEKITANNSSTYSAYSSDLVNWQTDQRLPEGIGPGLNVENYIFDDQHVFYFGGTGLRMGLTDSGKKWRFIDLDVENSGKYDVDFVLKTSQGIFLLYHHYSVISGKKYLEVKAICLDINKPTNIVWHTKTSLWQEPELWMEKESTCLGCIYFQGKLLSYWDVPDLGIYLVTYPMFQETPAHEPKHYKLAKHPENPILSPLPHHEWENEATFNPAAFYEDGKVYLIYRAVGYGYISVLGYAESSDGINFSIRLEEPIFTGNDAFDTKAENASFDTARKYLSGGSYGGCEDPRITKIDDRLYMVYVAFNGFDPPRLAITSILYDDFINHRFLWEKPVLISPPGIIDKSGCVLPEKINGKYVIFHRIYPNILIDFVDDLNFDGNTWLKGEFKITPRPTMWDSRKVGSGAPPIKTKDGWLLIYQAVTDNDDSKYKIGAMILDINDPTKVLYRSNQPIIEPTEHYENGLSKFGVVYPCGAVVKNGQLLVYYGGSDSVICLASANLDEFLKELKDGSAAKLTPIMLD